ncbi:MAG: hypothetical protein RMJ52_08575 [Gemmataceae bacterium]|nr:hypothetical protein [Gemmataceae bacterium]
MFARGAAGGWPIGHPPAWRTAAQTSIRRIPTSRRRRLKDRDPASSSLLTQGTTLLHRALLGLTTGLLVARPLVRGDDPGRLIPGLFPTDQVLTLLWLIVLALYLLERALRRDEQLTLSLPELGLAAVAIGFFLSASQASYQAPAWLIAWEWAGVAVVFFLVRRLAADEEEGRHLVSVLLATGVTIAVFALYQAGWEQPRVRAWAETQPARYRAWVAPPQLALSVEPVRPPTEALAAAVVLAPALVPPPAALPWGALVATTRHYRPAPEPLPPLPADWRQGHASGTFAAPSTLAAYLLLLLPAAALAAHVAWRQRRQALHPLLLAGAAAVMLAAWWQTGGWNLASSLSRLLDSWKPSWNLVAAYPYLGVGPGNFSRIYPRFLTTAEQEFLTEPRSFLLSLAASGGMGVLLLFLVSWAVFFWQAVCHCREGALSATDEETDDSTSPLGLIHWEYYLGGVFGLVLAFVLRVTWLPALEIRTEGLVAGGRSLVWFVFLALFDQVRWTEGRRVGALATGVALAGLFLAFHPGLLDMALLQALVAAAAVAGAGFTAGGSVRLWRHWWTYVVPVPLAITVVVAYWLTIVVPAAQVASRLHDAFVARARWRAQIEPSTRLRLDSPGVPKAMKDEALKEAIKYAAGVIKLLEEAAVADPGNIAPHVEEAYWFGELWLLAPDEGQFSTEAVRQTVIVQQLLDPEGVEGYLAEYRLRRMYAAASRTLQTRGVQLKLAIKALTRLVELRPTAAVYRYWLAETYYWFDSPTEGRKEAEIAWQLDQQNPQAPTSLSERQRQQVQAWLTGGAELSCLRPVRPIWYPQRRLPDDATSPRESGGG